LRLLRRCPLPDLTSWQDSSSGLDSLSEYHLRATAGARIARPASWSTNTSHAPPEVWSPSAFFQPRGATYLHRIPNSLVVLRPQSFALSRRFAPRTTYRVYFIPNPPLGFTLRGFHPLAAPYVILDVGPLLGFRLIPKNQPAPPGVNTRCEKPAHGAWGLARVPCRMPP